MSVDFSRAIRIRRNNTTVTHYGLTSAPSGHYIGFRSQGATRYIPLATGSRYLNVRVANATYSAYGLLTFTINLSNSKSQSGFYVRFSSTLSTITCNQGGASLSASVKIETYVNGNVLSTTNVTLNANTTSQTYNTPLFTNATFVYPTSIKVTVTINGKTATTQINSYVQSGSQSITVNVAFAPW